MKELTHLDLFSGIGGFSLAAGWAGFRTVGFVEIDLFCCEVLKKHWPEVPIYGDIKTLSWPLRQKEDGRKKSNTITVITGGFPCQPFSCAGKRRGKADDRFLWPEMLRVIRQARPAWVVGENVAGIINMELEQACLDLEGESYEVQPVIIPACAVGAPHRRDRVWIIAHAIEQGAGHRCGEVADEGGRVGQDRQEGIRQEDRAVSSGRVATTDRDTPDDEEVSERARLRKGEKGGKRRGRPRNYDNPASAYDPRSWGRWPRIGSWPGYKAWRIPWIEVTARLCRVDDGIPAWVHARRASRLKALGNAIVPQVAFEIFRVIAEIERAEDE